MAAVFRDAVITWGEREYKVTPTMRLLNRIEQDVSLADIALRVHRGKPPLSMIAVVLHHFLVEAGVKGVTSEDVYAELMTGSEPEIRSMVEQVFAAVFPERKNAEAPHTQPESSKTADR